MFKFPHDGKFLNFFGESYLEVDDIPSTRDVGSQLMFRLKEDHNRYFCKICEDSKEVIVLE